MITITKLSVKSLDVDYLDVFWEIENTYDDPYDYTFTVERSESALGPFDQVSNPFSDRYRYRDVLINPFHRHRQYWYRIKVTKKSDSSVTYSKCFSCESTLEGLVGSSQYVPLGNGVQIAMTR